MLLFNVLQPKRVPSPWTTALSDGRERVLELARLTGRVGMRGFHNKAFYLNLLPEEEEMRLSEKQNVYYTVTLKGVEMY